MEIDQVIDDTLKMQLQEPDKKAPVAERWDWYCFLTEDLAYKMGIELPEHIFNTK